MATVIEKNRTTSDLLAEIDTVLLCHYEGHPHERSYMVDGNAGGFSVTKAFCTNCGEVVSENDL